VIHDSPRDAALHSQKLRHGDIIVAYTDGFSDNVYPGEMLGYLAAIMRRNEPEKVLAQTLADFYVAFAQRCMYDTQRVSPFEEECALVKEEWVGGKVDDVTVVVIIVQEGLD